MLNKKKQIMNYKEALNIILKGKKINLNEFTCIYVSVDKQCKWLNIILAVDEICGGVRSFLQQKSVRLRYNAVINKCFLPEDFVTKGFALLDNHFLTKINQIAA